MEPDSKATALVLQNPYTCYEPVLKHCVFWFEVEPACSSAAGQQQGKNALPVEGTHCQKMSLAAEKKRPQQHQRKPETGQIDIYQGRNMIPEAGQVHHK